MISPKESGELIAHNAKQVNIQVEKLNELGDILVKKINSGTLCLNNVILSEFHPTPENPNQALNWLFVVKCVSFSLWKTNWIWKVERNKGYFAVCAAINRAIQQKIDILNPHFYSTVTKHELQHILRGDKEKAKIPRLYERMKCLNDSGAVLLKNFKGSFQNCVEEADHSAVKLLNIIVENFQWFRDEAEYNGSKVAFYKRAQMLITEIWVCFQNQGVGYFYDIDKLTAGACYRLPQILLYHNVLRYSEELWHKIQSFAAIQSGSEEEIEIRGCTINAVERLKEYIEARLQEGKTVNSILIDHFLWNERIKRGRVIEKKKLHYHRTRSIHY